MRLLGDKDKSVRTAAGVALSKGLASGKRGPAERISTRHVDLIASDLLTSSDPQARAAGETLLRAVLPRCSAEKLLKAIQGEDGWLRAEAMKALVQKAGGGRLQTTREQRRVLLGLLTSPSEQVRCSAAALLDASLTPAHAPFVQDALRSPEAQVRDYAARWIRAHPELLAKEELLARVGQSGSAERFLTLRALGSKELTAAEARGLESQMPVLIEGLMHPDAEVRRAAARLAGRLRHRGMATVPNLIRNLTHADPSVWRQARDALTEITDQALGPSDFADMAARRAATTRWSQWQSARGRQ